jgi:anti-sigma factor RsiW
MSKFLRPRKENDERDEELGLALREAAACFAGEGIRPHAARSARSARSSRRVLPLAAAAAALAMAAALGGIALSERGSMLRSSAEFAAWLLPERSAWVRDAEGVEPFESEPTLDFIERLWTGI